MWISSTPLRYGVGVAPAGRLQRALEVVDDRQQVGEDVGAGVLGQLAAFAFDALAVVVELGRGPQQPVLQRILFAAQRLACRPARSRRASLALPSDVSGGFWSV